MPGPPSRNLALQQCRTLSKYPAAAASGITAISTGTVSRTTTAIPPRMRTRLGTGIRTGIIRTTRITIIITAAKRRWADRRIDRPPHQRQREPRQEPRFLLLGLSQTLT